MIEPARKWISPEEYLALEERAETKSEYFDGEIFAKAGAAARQPPRSPDMLNHPAKARPRIPRLIP